MADRVDGGFECGADLQEATLVPSLSNELSSHRHAVLVEAARNAQHRARRNQVPHCGHVRVVVAAIIERWLIHDSWTHNLSQMAESQIRVFWEIQKQ